MNINWVEVSPHSSYSVRKDVYRCRTCGAEFEALFPNGNELVKFIEDGGGEVRWLPTFEDGGYLDLVEKLVPDFSKNQSISMPIAKKFETEFRRIQETSSVGNTFSVAVGCRCPSCNNDNKEILSEEILESPSLDWLRYKLK